MELESIWFDVDLSFSMFFGKSGEISVSDLPHREEVFDCVGYGSFRG